MSLRDLPSVERLLQTDSAAELVSAFGRPLTLQAVRQQLEAARSAIRGGEPPPEPEILLERTRAALEGWLRPSLRPVINATGVIIHTNLGRAPLSRSAQEAVQRVAAEYSTLEYDLAEGARSKREVHAEGLLLRLTGAGAALVVNNNASAVLLTLTALARDRDVLISRSQLIEIGGGFRIPEVLAQSGARLVEVGTTNRTHLEDFERAMRPETALILRAHHSNFKIVGFTSEPSLDELVMLGRKGGVPVLDDLGSGSLLDTSLYGLEHEPTVQESLQAGASVVAFSGDKLLGGPQAGILLGEESILERLRNHPMARAVRPDKLCLAALTATLNHYLMNEAVESIPIWQMIAASPEELRSRAEGWRRALGAGEISGGQSTVGGGSLPEETLPTWLLAFQVDHPDRTAQRLRTGLPPVVGRIEGGKVVFDPRTVLDTQEEAFLQALRASGLGGT